MLKVNREEIGGGVVFQLSGTIDEASELERQFAQLPPVFTVSCKKIDRINCAGVRNWIKFFRNATAKGHQYKFIECSPALVDQFNSIKAFPCEGEISSIYLPYVCKPCRTQFVQLVAVPKLKLIYKNLPAPACPKCTRPAEFDDVTPDYFEFIEAA